MESRSSATEVVMAYLKAMNNHDYETARSYLHDTIFSSRTPMGSCETADQFLMDASKTQATYELKKVLADGSDVCLLFNTKMPAPAITFLTCGWYHVRDGKIDSVNLIFDASPFTAAQGDEDSNE